MHSNVASHCCPILCPKVTSQCYNTLLLYDIHQNENILFCDAQISYIVIPPLVQTFHEMVNKGSFSDIKKFLQVILPCIHNIKELPGIN